MKKKNDQSHNNDLEFIGVRLEHLVSRVSVSHMVRTLSTGGTSTSTNQREGIILSGPHCGQHCVVIGIYLAAHRIFFNVLCVHILYCQLSLTTFLF